MSTTPLEPGSTGPLTWGATPGAPTQISAAAAMSNYPADAARPVGFTDAVTSPEFRLFVAATEVWESVANVRFSYPTDAPQGSAQPADIRVGLGEIDTALGAPKMSFVGETEYGWGAGNRFLPDTLVAIEDPAETPTTLLPDGDQQYDGSQTTMFQSMIHELGHALGLDHNPGDPNSIMNPALGQANRMPDANDIAAIQSLYGAPTQAVAFASPAEGAFYDGLTRSA